MTKLLAGPAGNLRDDRYAENVDFRNRGAGRPRAQTLDIEGVLVMPGDGKRTRSIIGRATDQPRGVGQGMGFDVLDWLSRKLSSTSDVQPRLTPKVRIGDSRYHAVSIRAGDPCCAAARQFGQLRMLSARAPALPLPSCNVATCTCRYARYSDRRSGIDRRAVYDLDRERNAEFVNRRRNHGRRATDARVWSGNGQA
jgi:hypothetical protein